jgi:hypothetical protein
LYYFGYIVYFFAFQQKLDKQWEENIWEESYDVTQTGMIKIPLSLPYMANQEDFQTTNLSMEMEGQYLRVVKQRYQNDTLQIIYIKDYQQQKLENQLKDWIKSITDTSPTNKTERNQLFGKFFPKDFMGNEFYTFHTWDGLFTSTRIPTRQNHYSNIFLSLKTPPPQVG